MTAIEFLILFKLQKAGATQALNTMGELAQASKVSKEQMSLLNMAMAKSGTQLGQIAKVSDEVATGFGRGAERGQKYSATVTELGGKQFKLNMVMKDGANGLIATSASLQEVGKSSIFAGINLGALIGRALLTIPVWLALRAAVTGLIQGFKASMEVWKEVESAMAEIAIASELTKAQLKSLQAVVITLATVYGTSLKDMLGAAKLFAQQGLSVEDTIQMTRSAAIGAQVLGQTVTEVAEELTAAMRAYNLSASDSMMIVDQWMMVQKKFAVTAKDLGEGFKTAGASAATFGISTAKFAGHLTAIIEVTRKSGSEAANSLQMMYTRVLTTGKDAVQQVAKIPVYMDASGKATMEATNVYRDIGPVLDDIASKWDTLTKSEKNQLAVAIGSRRQMAPFFSLMDAYPRSLEAMIAAYKSAGEAIRDFNIKQDTVEVKIKQMQSSWSSLSATIAQTGAWKGMLSALTAWALAMQKAISIDAAYRDSALRTNLIELSRVETQLNEIQNLKKLIDLRTEYSKRAAEAKTPESQNFFVDFLKQLRGAIPVGATVTPASEAAAVRAVMKARVLVERPDIGGAIAKYEALSQQKPPQAGTAVPLFAKNLAAAKKAYDIATDALGKEIKSKIAAYNVDQDAIAAEVLNAKIAKEALDTADQAERKVQSTANIMKARGASELQVLEYLAAQYQYNTAILGGAEEQTKKEQILNQLAEKRVQIESDLLKTQEQGSDNIKLAAARASGVQSKEKELRLELELVAANQYLYDSETKVLKILELQSAIIVEQYAQVEKIASSLASTFQGGLEDFFKGTSNFESIFTNLGKAMSDSFISQVSAGLTESLFNFTGMGDIFGISMTQVKGMLGGLGGKIEAAHSTVYDFIVRGHKDGIAQAQAMAAAGGGAYRGEYPTGTYYPGAGGDLYGPRVGGETPVFGMQGGPLSTYASGGSVLGQSLKTPKTSGPTGMQKMGYASGAMLTAYSLAQSARTGGGGMGAAGGIASGVGSLAMGAGSAAAAGVFGAGAMAGGLMGMGALIPGIGLALMAAGLIMTFIASSKKSSQTSVETRVAENRVASKIDVSNKQLEIVNRNLVALRADVKTYILPASAYFSTKRNLEDEFALSSMRGFAGA